MTSLKMILQGDHQTPSGVELKRKVASTRENDIGKLLRKQQELQRQMAALGAPPLIEVRC
jgi:hypothetical protein